jgi:hypothetical protein
MKWGEIAGELGKMQSKKEIISKHDLKTKDGTWLSVIYNRMKKKFEKD